MLIDFTKIEERTVLGMNGGTGKLSAKMYRDQYGKIIPSKIHAGGSIGMHRAMILIILFLGLERQYATEKKNPFRPVAAIYAEKGLNIAL